MQTNTGKVKDKVKDKAKDSILMFDGFYHIIRHFKMQERC